MKFPRDAMLSFIAVAETVAAKSSFRAVDPNNNKRLEAVFSARHDRKLDSSSKSTKSPSSKSTKSPTSKSTKSPSSKSTKTAKFGKSNIFRRSLTPTQVNEALGTVAESSNIPLALTAFAERVQLTENCHTGSPAVVEDLCDDCCDGTLACDWTGDATVCDGACSGDNACNGIATGSVIMAGSCNGMSACVNLDSNSNNPTPVLIAPGSCIGDATVLDANGQDVGGRSCAGISAETLIVGSGSCDESRACYFIGRPFTAVDAVVSTTVTIAPDACTATGACGFIGVNATTIAVGEGACDDEYSCYSLGYVSTTSVDIGNGACTGQNYKCFYFGYDFAGEVGVAANTCTTSAEICCSPEIDLGVDVGTLFGCVAECTGSDGACVGDTTFIRGTEATCGDICVP